LTGKEVWQQGSLAERNFCRALWLEIKFGRKEVWQGGGWLEVSLAERKFDRGS
jgi:hypothetical protein